MEHKAQRRLYIVCKVIRLLKKRFDNSISFLYENEKQNIKDCLLKKESYLKQRLSTTQGNHSTITKTSFYYRPLF
jgi:hypothetical protein